MEAKIYNWNAWTEETRPDFLVSKYKTDLQNSGFKIVDEVYHFFDPFGFTALFLLSESHFAIHTFPEEDKTYLELSSCVKEYYDAFKKQQERTEPCSKKSIQTTPIKSQTE